jgi:drug/metabolite transporter (DMT)-like permease
MSTPQRVLGIPATIFAMGLWVTATALEASMMGVLRHIGTGLDPLQIVFMRCLFGLVFFLPFILRSTRAMHTTRLNLHLTRAMLQVVSMMLWFSAIPLIPLTDIAALSFLAPLFATIGAIFILKEKVGWRRGLAMAVGFAGVMVLLRPGFESVNAGSLMIIGSASLWALALLVIKSLARTDNPALMTAWSNLLLTPITLVPALFVWQWPTTEQWILMAIVGFSASCSHMCMGLAFRLADASKVLPMDFSRMVWTAIVGYIFFAQMPTIFTFIGGFMIFGAATYVTIREARLARRAAGEADILRE